LRRSCGICGDRIHKDLTGRYVYFNEASWTQFGIRPEAIVGRTDEEIWPGENAALYRENDAAVVAAQKPMEFVELVVHANGPHSWLIYKFPIIEGGARCWWGSGRGYHGAHQFSRTS